MITMSKKFDEIRNALEEHLSSINENTSEIQALFDYLHEMDVKIEKISQRLDLLQLDTKKTQVAPLNQLEKKVFLTLYTEETPLSYKEISVKAEIPLSLVPECISSLVGKGIPFQRSLVNSQLFLSIDPKFKDIQAKENLVNLSLDSFIE